MTEILGKVSVGTLFFGCFSINVVFVCIAVQNCNCNVFISIFELG